MICVFELQNVFFIQLDSEMNKLIFIYLYNFFSEFIKEMKKNEFTLFVDEQIVIFDPHLLKIC